jgi:hypothetical protein
LDTLSVFDGRFRIALDAADNNSPVTSPLFEGVKYRKFISFQSALHKGVEDFDWRLIDYSPPGTFIEKCQTGILDEFSECARLHDNWMFQVCLLMNIYID